MFSAACRVLCLAFSFVLVLTPGLNAQQANTAAAPLPPQLLDAHTVFVANGGGSNYFEEFGGGPNRAYNTFYKDLKRANRYELVSSPEQADVIFEIRAIAPEVYGGNDTSSYNPQVVLTIRDPKTNVVLWTESANVRAAGTRNRRDRRFDMSVAVLVDKLALVTGQPLTQAQTKAIADNSRMSIEAKVFLGAALAGVAGMTAWGIHRMNSQKSIHEPPPTPTIP